MKEKFPPALPPEELTKFVQGEIDLIARLEVIALSPDRSLPERRDAIAQIKGICLRLGSMLLRSPEIIAEIEPEVIAEVKPLIKAEGTAAARSKAAQTREPSDKLMQETIARHEPQFPPGRRGLAKHVAKELGVHPKTVQRHLKKKRTR
jgi:hypothetical protein